MFLGTDPEAFIVDQNRKAIPAWKLFPDKDHKIVPFPGFGLFRDGFAVEINVPPAPDAETVVLHMLKAQADLRRRLPIGLRISTMPTVRVNLEEILLGAPLDGMVFGCEPSWNARTGAFESIMLDATEHSERFAGGHLHIAWTKREVDAAGSPWAWLKDPQLVMRYVLLLDQFVGYPLSVWFAKPETFARRQYYGQAGDFRFQDYGGEWYGVEYRTPGPEVWNSPIPATFAYAAMKAVAKQFRMLNRGFDEGLSRDLGFAINNGVEDAPLLERCYIPLDGARSTRKQFLRVVAKQRPSQELAEGAAISAQGWNSLPLEGVA